MKYKAGYKYQLHEDCYVKVSIYPDKKIITEYITLDQAGNLYIKRGYCWDGCSGPTWDDKKNMEAGLVHDALYQLMREDHLSQKWREQADRELYRLCIEAGMFKVRAWYYYKAVRMFGLSSASAENQKKIYEAP